LKINIFATLKKVKSISHGMVAEKAVCYTRKEMNNALEEDFLRPHKVSQKSFSLQGFSIKTSVALLFKDYFIRNLCL
jgi:hypothetical protein